MQKSMTDNNLLHINRARDHMWAAADWWAERVRCCQRIAGVRWSEARQISFEFAGSSTFRTGAETTWQSYALHTR